MFIDVLNNIISFHNIILLFTIYKQLEAVLSAIVQINPLFMHLYFHSFLIHKKERIVPFVKHGQSETMRNQGGWMISIYEILCDPGMLNVIYGICI